MKKMIQTALLCTIFSLSSFAFAERFEGESAYLTQAKNGDTLAQYTLAREYCKIGDFPQALYWVEKRAEHPDEL